MNADLKYDNKYKVYNKYISNIFINEKDKYICSYVYSKTINEYFLLQKVFQKCEYKKFIVYDCDTNLNLEPLNYINNTIITITQNHTIYKFLIYDLIKIIKMSLLSTTNLFSEPYRPKNPYNNIKFSYCNLINIYLFILDKKITMPNHFYLFFKSNFKIKVFLTNNECFLRNEAIKDFYSFNNNNNDEKYNDIIMMLRYYSIPNMTVHPYFDKLEIINAFDKYLTPYLYTKYSFTHELKHYYNIYITNELTKFVKENPLFGRIYYNKNKNNKYNITKYCYNNLLSKRIPNRLKNVEEIVQYNSALDVTEIYNTTVIEESESEYEYEFESEL